MPREELWHCMRKAEVVENYVRVVQMDSRCLCTMIFTEDIVICSEGADRREFGEVEV